MQKKRVKYDSIKSVLKYHLAGAVLDSGLPHLSLYRMQSAQLVNLTRLALEELAANASHQTLRWSVDEL